jgi:hypothetical protein
LQKRLNEKSQSGNGGWLSIVHKGCGFLQVFATQPIYIGFPLINGAVTDTLEVIGPTTVTAPTILIVGAVIVNGTCDKIVTVGGGGSGGSGFWFFLGCCFVGGLGDGPRLITGAVMSIFVASMLIPHKDSILTLLGELISIPVNRFADICVVKGGAPSTLIPRVSKVTVCVKSLIDNPLLHADSK